MSLDTALITTAELCIENDGRRTDNEDGGWDYFTDSETALTNQLCGSEGDRGAVTSGHCFLYPAKETFGLTRFFYGDSDVLYTPRCVF